MFIAGDHIPNAVSFTFFFSFVNLLRILSVWWFQKGTELSFDSQKH